MPTKTTNTNGTPKRARTNNPSPDLDALRRQRQQASFTDGEKAMIEAGRNFIAALIRQEEKENASAV